MEGYTRGNHNVHRLTYHLVFVTKYRKPVITDEMGKDMVLRAEEVLATQGGGPVTGETDRDHMHLLIWLQPNCNVSNVVRLLKTQLSKFVHLYYMDDVQKHLYGDTPFWSPSYFIATTGSVSPETVKEYIESQRTEEHQAKKISKKLN